MPPASHGSSPALQGKGAGSQPVVARRWPERPAATAGASVGAAAAASLPEGRSAAAAGLEMPPRSVVRYRGFVLLPQKDLGWLVRPERSPMTILPFRTPPLSLSDAKALIDRRLNAEPARPEQALVRGAEPQPFRRSA